MYSDPGMIQYPYRVALALQPPGWGFTPCGAVSPRGTTVCVPGLLELQMYGKISNPGMGPHPPWVALAHAGSMAGIIPLAHQSSRKSQQPLGFDPG